MLLLIGLAQLLGALFVKLRHPKVIGEILAGIVLGPALLGKLPYFAGFVGSAMHKSDVLDFIYWVGLLLLMFLSGAETQQLFTRAGTDKPSHFAAGLRTAQGLAIAKSCKEPSEPRPGPGEAVSSCLNRLRYLLNPNTIDTEDCRKGLSLAMPKEKIHPNYAAVRVMCACGNNFETRSTHKGDIHVEICSNCHPFFTGKQRLVDTAGRVERFRRKYAKAAETSPAK